MNKDTLVASIIGLALGLVAAIGLWVVPRMLQKSTQLQPKTESSETASGSDKSPTSSQDLAVNSPFDGEIIKSSQIKITGTAVKDALIVVTSSETQKVTRANDGNFSVDFDLKEGGNSLVVSALYANNEVSKNLNVFYFSENL